MGPFNLHMICSFNRIFLQFCIVLFSVHHWKYPVSFWHIQALECGSAAVNNLKNSILFYWICFFTLTFRCTWHLSNSVFIVKCKLFEYIHMHFSFFRFNFFWMWTYCSDIFEYLHCHITGVSYLCSVIIDQLIISYKEIFWSVMLVG